MGDAAELAKTIGEMVQRIRYRAIGRATILCVLWFSCASVRALDLGISLPQFHHTAWTLKDGGPGQVQAIAQTRDGYLWLGTPNGLFRFDGVRFESFDALGDQRLAHRDVFSLAAEASGGLWVGFTNGGAAFVKDGRVRNYGESDGLSTRFTAYRFTTDADGNTWVLTGSGPLKFNGSRWDAIEKEAGYPAGIKALDMVFDLDGTMWLSTQDDEQGIFYRKRGTIALQSVPLEHLHWAQLAVAPDGRVWVSDPIKERGTRPLPPGGVSSTWQDRWWKADHRMLAPAWDHDGALWFGAGEGLQRWIPPAPPAAGSPVAEPRVETFTSEQGLSGDFVRAVMEDRERNIWVGTSGGLDRFRSSKLTPVLLPKRPMRVLLAPGSDGGMWISSWYEGLMHASGSVDLLLQLKGVDHITAMHAARDGSLYLAHYDGVDRLDGKKTTTRLPLPAGVAHLGVANALLTDDTGSLWVSGALPGGPLLRFDGKRWIPYGPGNGFPEHPAVTLHQGVDGRLWLGSYDVIARWQGADVKIFTAANGVRLGRIDVFSDRHGVLWAAGEHGLQWFDGARFHSVHTVEDGALDGTSGMVETAGGDLWLNASRGITHLSAGEIKKAVADADYRMRFERFDRLDGIPGTPEQLRPIPTAAESTDGRLWFALTNGVVTVDPKHIRRNAVVPTVLIQSVQAGKQHYEPAGELSLPVGLNDLQVDYTATSLAIPERVLFRYKLEGFDKDWHNAGSRRQAFYTNLRPGTYRFRVRACNDDGLWNETGATLAFTIPPAFYQTRWFYALCALATIAVLALLYRFRVRQVTAAVRARLEERIVERERIARELHDTLLQGLQGLILRFHAVSARIPSREPEHDMMEHALKCADEVLIESRDRVKDLRASPDLQVDLPTALSTLGQELTQEQPVEFSVAVEGTIRALHPILREEAFMIGREALLNAFRHARAHRIEVEVAFSPKMLSLRVRDDGCGLEPAVLKSGRTGHWGLIGMRERAKKVRSHLEIWSRRGVGTEVELRVPASVAYRGGATAERWGWFRRALGLGDITL